MTALAQIYHRKRSGLLAEKIGMTYIYSEAGARVPVTVFQLHDTVVMNIKERAKAGYDAVVLATKDIREKKQTKPLRAIYAKAGLENKKYIKEFRVAADALPAVGSRLYAEHFMVGQFVDVTAISIGKGFAGVMKRHNFRGLEASHGVSVSHRSHGSTGQRQDPGRVFKNKKMAGHMGVDRVTMQNLEVVRIDSERQLIFVKGGTPGAKGGFAEVKDAVKRALHPRAPYPTFVPKQQISAQEETAVLGAEPQQDNSGE